jgi:hypothetical protein
LSLGLLVLAGPAEAAKPSGNSNDPPVISGTPGTSAMVGSWYSFQPVASDPNGDKLTFRISGKPSWATFDSATGQLSGTPTTAGTFSGIAIRVTDGRTAVSLPKFSITVTSAAAIYFNTAPTISGVALTSAQVDQPYAFQPKAADADGDKLTFSIQGKPSWATFDMSTGMLYGTPAAAHAGTYSNIVIGVSDGKLTAELAPYSITVVSAATVNVNKAPEISGAAVTSAQVDRPYAFKPTAADADGDKLTFSIQGKPSWAIFDMSTGTLYGTPSAAHTGTYSNIVISVSDGNLTAALAPFSITVEPALSKTVTLKWTAPTMNTDGYRWQ